jgi:hypothetical protein
VEERTVSDFLDQKRQEITDRLKELKPVVDEYSRLEAAAGALAAAVGDLIGTAASEVSAAASAAVTRRRGPGHPRGSSASKKGPGRPRGSGKRAGKATAASGPAVASASATVERKKPGRPKGTGKKVGRPAGKVGRPKARRGGRPKGGGKRAREALSLVQGQPGITIPELAAKMGIKQNYLYRLLPGLEQEGKLEKKGRGWHPKS